MSNSKKKKIKVKTWIIVLFGLISLCGVVFYSYKIITWFINTNENKEIKEKLDKKIKKPTKENVDYIIDFEGLKKTNPDTVGYIKVNNTNIDYVVVKGNDNSYYLNHNFEKERNIAGWVFADFRNKLDESDKNIIIYGHDTKDGSMFGTLNKVLRKEWYKDKNNYKIDFVTESKTYNYEVFSMYSIEPEDYYITTEFHGDSFKEFIKTIKSRSIYDTGVEVNENDKVLTLSSCLYEGRKRVVLHAKLIS